MENDPALIQLPIFTIALIIILITAFVIILKSLKSIGPTEIGLVNKRFSISKLSDDNPIAFNGEAGYQEVLLMPGLRFKLWPILIFPIFLRKLMNQKWKMLSSILAFSIFVIVIFIPVFRAGLDENQGLMKYAANWINNAAFYTLLKDGIELFTTTFKIYYVCADCVARWITGGIILLVLLLLIRKPAKDNSDLANKILIIIAVSFLISPTQFPWYLTWLILPLVFSPKLSLLMYAFLIPLYYLNPLGSYFIYIQHLPVIILFLYEIKKGSEFNFFKLPSISEKN